MLPNAKVIRLLARRCLSSSRAQDFANQVSAYLSLSPSSSLYPSLSQFGVVLYENLQKLRGVAVGSYRRLNTGSGNPAKVLGDHASKSGKFAIRKCNS